MNSIDQSTRLQGDGSVVDREVGITGWMWSSCRLFDQSFMVSFILSQAHQVGLEAPVGTVD